MCGISGRNASSVAVCSHQFARAAVVAFVQRQAGQVGDHQDEDEQRDDAGFRRDLAQPLGPRHEAANRQAGDGDGNRHREHGHKSEIDLAETAVAAQKRKAETGRQVIQSDQRERAEAPKYKGVRQCRAADVRG